MAATYDMAVIGGGPGGYSAALYAVRAGLRVVVLEKLCPGGQMALTDQIENYPGFDQGVDGFALGEAMRRGAERFGAETVLAEVLRCDLTAVPKRIETSGGTFFAKTLVYAAGAVPRELGVPGEAAFAAKGVHYCASCDGMFYKGKDVMVVGGGNSAVEDALALSRIADRVTLIHRRDTLRAEKISVKALESRKNVDFCWNSNDTALRSMENRVAVALQNGITGEETERITDGVFVSIGRKPATELVKGQLMLDPAGYLPADESTRTQIPGVFAVGDVRAKEVRQIVTAAADGAAAAHFAQEYLAGKD